MAMGCIDMHSGINLFLNEAAGIRKAHADAASHTPTLPVAGDGQCSETRGSPATMTPLGVVGLWLCVITFR